MLKAKSFLAVDFGAGSLKLAEFEVNEAGNLRLKQYGIKALGLQGSQESTREATILKALQEMMASMGVKSREVNVCAPGFHVFSKFVKLPPVDTGKVTQIIQYEAQQNVPFPLEEVVWDYQILGTTPGGELEVLLVAIKADIVEGLFRVAETSKLHLQVADVSPAALCNAFRYNYGDLEDCTMLLDIGAKTSNLLFFERGKVFSRSINLGANSITQDFANESKLKFDAAEKIKIEEGFVSLGGAYAEPENPHQAAISKIARQFMTRLHIQVNQTMQFYRGQQGGSAPQRLFLSGGASLMPYTAQFFAEKLNVPVEYFNPFRNVEIDPAVNLEDLARVAHSLGEVVGLGLRNLAHCPVELNLIPASTRKWQSFSQKKPYLVATVFSLVAVVFVMGALFQKLADVKKEELDGNVMPHLGPLEAKAAQFNRAQKNLQQTEQDLDQMLTWMEGRYHWADVLAELRRIMEQTEDKTRQQLRTDTGVWIEQMFTTAPVVPLDPMAEQFAPEPPPPQQPTQPEHVDPFMAAEMANQPNQPVQPEAPQPEAAPAGILALAAPGAKEISTIKIVCRTVGDGSNRSLVYALLNELRASPMFERAEPASNEIYPDESTSTYAFDLMVSLKQPLKL